MIVSDLRKAFNTPAGSTIEVLRGVTFRVAAGEIVAITGASGAGKSTLLHVLAGLEAADDGSIVLGEVEIRKAGEREVARLRRREMGFIFQFHHLLPDLTAVENVALPLLINRETRREAVRLATELLDKTGLGVRARHPILHLSGGEQQRVAVARALVTQPRVVLADEPTGNLDTAIGDEIGAMLREYSRRSGAAVVIATHNLRLARTCDRILGLQEGLLFEHSGNFHT